MSTVCKCFKRQPYSPKNFCFEPDKSSCIALPWRPHQPHNRGVRGALMLEPTASPMASTVPSSSCNSPRTATARQVHRGQGSQEGSCSLGRVVLTRDPPTVDALAPDLDPKHAGDGGDRLLKLRAQARLQHSGGRCENAAKRATSSAGSPSRSRRRASRLPPPAPAGRKRSPPSSARCRTPRRWRRPALCR